MTNWNGATALPRVAPGGADVRVRCQVPPGRTPAHRALEEAGWIPYDHLDRALALDDVEIVAGMTGADDLCRPAPFQIFVFVGGRLAGTLSPRPMGTGRDGSAGAVRIMTADTVTAEFARYGNQDAPCCPTARMTVRYRIDRSTPRPIIVPTDIRTTRRH